VDSLPDEPEALSAFPTAVLPPEKNPAQENVWDVGGVIAGRYRLVQTLGKGGMGAVILAEDLFLRRQVALKTMHPELARNPAALNAFRQEVALAHAVNHPNLARTFDLGQAAGVTFITMEYLPGESLKQRLQREGPLPLREALRLGTDVAQAMYASHLAGVVHRDLKPANVQLTPDRGAVVMDFGLAAGTEHKPLPRVVAAARSEYIQPSSSSAGTPTYMAPEQWRGEPQGPATDVYAFGCILFEMLSGRSPFLAQNRHAMRAAHLEARPPAVRTLRPEAPAALEKLILQCLEKDPARRPSSMYEVARRLAPSSVVPHFVTAGMALAASLVLLLAGWGLWTVAKSLLISQMQPAAMCLAERVAAAMDREHLDAIRSPRDIDTPGFQSSVAAMHRLREQYPVIRYAYTMRMVRPPAGWEFVVDADPLDHDLNGDGVLVEDEKGSPPGLVYNGLGYPGLLRAYQQRRTAAEPDIRIDDWGIFFSAYAPVAARPGKDAAETFYLAGVDLYNSPLVRLRLVIQVVFTLLAVGAAAAIVVLRWRQRRELMVGSVRAPQAPRA
jgi:hypothetical protein